MNIRYIKQNDIDRKKWDTCIYYAHNGNVYGYSWFLNNVAKEWDALVEGDYESVFPLIWRENAASKKELYQPELIRESGIYSSHLISAGRLKQFLEVIPSEFSTINIHLNKGTQSRGDIGFDFNKINNHELILNQSYEMLEKKYSPLLHQLLENAKTFGLLPASNLKPEVIADFYKKQNNGKKDVEQKFHTYQRIMYNAIHRGISFSTGVMDQKGELCAVNFFLYSHGKILSILSVERENVAQKGAMALLQDLVIRTHAGRPIVFDFNTSSSKNIATEFGAEATFFYHLRKKE